MTQWVSTLACPEIKTSHYMSFSNSPQQKTDVFWGCAPLGKKQMSFWGLYLILRPWQIVFLQAKLPCQESSLQIWWLLELLSLPVRLCTDEYGDFIQVSSSWPEHYCWCIFILYIYVYIYIYLFRYLDVFFVLLPKGKDVFFFSCHCLLGDDPIV